MTSKTLDCLLISPPIFYKNTEAIWEQISSNFPPLGLAELAGYVRSTGFSVDVVDCNVMSPSVEGFEEYFVRSYQRVYSEIRYVGLTAMTPTVKKAYYIARIVKRFYPDARIVFGGVHATFQTAEVLSNGFVDYVVRGEGEYTLAELLSGGSPETIAGLAYRRGNEVVMNPERPRIGRLDGLPMPAYDLLPISRYYPAKGTFKNLPAMSLVTSRGCPGHCTFCNKTLGPQVVYKSAATIHREIRYLMDNHGVREILFYDDTLTLNKNNILELCRLLMEGTHRPTWTCFARVNHVDPDQLRLMRRAGCHQIMFGVENASETVLKNVKKEISLDQIRRAVAWTKQAGIDCRLAFMVGNPGDTRAVILENMRFIRELDPELLVVNITTPFPGTEMYEQARREGRLLTDDWDDYNLAKPVMRIDGMSVDEILEMYRAMYRAFYLRPRYMLGRLCRIRSWRELFRLADGLKALLNFLVLKRSDSPA
ncbi:MAG TPA: radical SAM protein [Elusimicrobiota bacterium]|nr:radical SAM protein [Elusimicrobiota bacterium]